MKREKIVHQTASIVRRERLRPPRYRRSASAPASFPWPRDDLAPDNRIAGYRLLDELGRGDRAVVYRAENVPKASARGRVLRDVALKIFNEGVAAHSIDDEIEILRQTRSAHLPKLLASAEAANGARFLVFERMAGGDLGTLLALRQGIRAGELVTVLVSLARGLFELQAQGWSHGALTPRAVLFDRNGKPVLCGFGRARRIEDDAGGSASFDREDWRGYGAIAEDLFAVLSDDGREAQIETIREAIHDLTEEGSDVERVRSLDEALFELAQPAPVSLAGIDRRTELIRERSENGKNTTRRERRAALRKTAPGAAAATGTSSIGSRVAAFGAKRRRSLIAGVGIASVVVAGALLLIPSKQDSVQARGEEERIVLASTATATPSPSSPPRSPDPGTDGTASDDPVAAAEALLAERDHCLEESSLSCLRTVLQEGSGLWADDAKSIEEPSGGAAESPKYGTRVVSLIERVGDSALVDLASATSEGVNDEPASALLVKGEAGWRLREIFRT